MPIFLQVFFFQEKKLCAWIYSSLLSNANCIRKAALKRSTDSRDDNHPWNASDSPGLRSESIVAQVAWLIKLYLIIKYQDVHAYLLTYT
jgi:hypothetical protein